jgi:predicted Fe-Mo cluster-binding NifX family protein
MNICIPVEEDKGLESQVCEHFGSAPVFLIVNTDDGACRAIPNTNHQHAHGMCQPLMALAGEDVNGVVVGGIGMGAVMKLNAGGIQVLKSGFATVRETVDAYNAGQLPQVTAQTACGQHGHGGGQGCGGHGQQ